MNFSLNWGPPPPYRASDLPTIGLVQQWDIKMHVDVENASKDKCVTHDSNTSKVYNWQLEETQKTHKQ